jgi:sugar phosphate isomerase/epimerase
MHPRISVNLINFPASGLAEDLAACKALGAHRIGVPIAKMEEAGGWSAGIDAVKKSGFTVATVLHPFCFDLDTRGSWEAQRAALIRSLDAAKTLGAECVYSTSGKRGSLTWEEAEQAFVEAMKPVAAHAREVKLPLVIEPVPALYPDYAFAHTLPDTLHLAQAAGIGICIDVFSCWTDRRLKETIERAAPITSLIQVGDYRFGDRSLPNRSVPGDGNIPLERILGWIHGAGYRGSYDLELIGPRIEAEGIPKAMARAAEWLGALLRKLGV